MNLFIQNHIETNNKFINLFPTSFKQLISNHSIEYLRSTLYSRKLELILEKKIIIIKKGKKLKRFFLIFLGIH